LVAVRKTRGTDCHRNRVFHIQPSSPSVAIIAMDIEARYPPNDEISVDDLAWLVERVKVPHERVR
jgi:hypothetical protein